MAAAAAAAAAAVVVAGRAAATEVARRRCSWRLQKVPTTLQSAACRRERGRTEASSFGVRPLNRLVLDGASSIAIVDLKTLNEIGCLPKMPIIRIFSFLAARFLLTGGLQPWKAFRRRLLAAKIGAALENPRLYSAYDGARCNWRFVVAADARRASSPSRRRRAATWRFRPNAAVAPRLRRPMLDDSARRSPLRFAFYSCCCCRCCCLSCRDPQRR